MNEDDVIHDWSMEHVPGRNELSHLEGVTAQRAKSGHLNSGDLCTDQYGDCRLFEDKEGTYKENSSRAQKGEKDFLKKEISETYHSQVGGARPVRTTLSCSGIGAARQRRPLKSQPYSDQVVHTSYNRRVPVSTTTLPSSALVSPSTTTSPVQVVPRPPQTPTVRRGPPTDPFSRPAWLGPQPSPGDLSFLDSPLGPVSLQKGSRGGGFMGEDQDQEEGEVAGAPTHSLRSRVLNYGLTSNRDRAANMTAPQRTSNTPAMAVTGSECNITGGIQCARGGQQGAVGRAGAGWSTGVTDEWGSTQESDGSSRSSSQGGDGLTSGQLLCPDGASSKWDAFREEKEGEGAALNFYHSRFSPQPPKLPDCATPLLPATPILTTAQTQPGHQTAGQEWQAWVTPDMEEEWQEDFVASDLPEENNGGACPDKRHPDAPPVSEGPASNINSPELFSQTDFPPSSRDDTPTSYRSQYFPPNSGHQNHSPSPGPASYFPDTPNTSPGSSIGTVIPDKATRGLMPRFRAPRPVGGAPDPGRSQADGWAGRPHAGAGRPHPGTDPISPRDQVSKVQTSAGVTQVATTYEIQK